MKSVSVFIVILTELFVHSGLANLEAPAYVHDLVDYLLKFIVIILSITIAMDLFRIFKKYIQ
ncbi:MAG: hypothetical protein QXP80_05890 [Zestosphaera sp.]